MLNLTFHARSDEAFRRLIARFVDLHASDLFNPHWGEQVRAGPDNRLRIKMVFQGLSKAEASLAFKLLLDFADANPADKDGPETMSVADVSARYLWNG